MAEVWAKASHYTVHLGEGFRARCEIGLGEERGVLVAKETEDEGSKVTKPTPATAD